MPTYGDGKAEWATKTVALTPEVKVRLERLRAYPREPLWSVLSRLLIEHDRGHGKKAPEQEVCP